LRILAFDETSLWRIANISSLKLNLSQPEIFLLIRCDGENIIHEEFKSVDEARRAYEWFKGIIKGQSI